MAATAPLMCGVLDDAISPVVKAWVKQGNRMVCGIIGPGTSRTLSSRWESPPEQSNLGSSAGQEPGVSSSVTTFSSTQIWHGNMPEKFSLNLIFMARSNAFTEVMQPLQWLEEFASGDVRGMNPIDLRAAALAGGNSHDAGLTGRIPSPVSINIGRKILAAYCIIRNISIPLDKEKTADGNLIRAEVTLDLQTMVMLNRNDVAGTWTGTTPS